MADAKHPVPDPSELVVEAEAKQAFAEKLHETADRTPLGSDARAMAKDADLEADEEWEAASAVTSKLEGFTGGEAAE